VRAVEDGLQAYAFNPAMHQSGILTGGNVRTCTKSTWKEKSGSGSPEDRQPSCGRAGQFVHCYRPKGRGSNLEEKWIEESNWLYVASDGVAQANPDITAKPR